VAESAQVTDVIKMVCCVSERDNCHGTPSCQVKSSRVKSFVILPSRDQIANNKQEISIEMQSKKYTTVSHNKIMVITVSPLL